MQMASNSENRVYAGFFVRLAAFLLDMLLVNIMLLWVKIPVWCMQLMFGDSFLFEPMLFSYNFFDVLYYVLTVSYFILATYFCGTTLGKYLLKIKVISTDGQPLSFMSVLVRETIGRYLSAMILYIGYMIAGWDIDKQGLHDRIADTYVVYRTVGVEKVQTALREVPAMKNENKESQGEV